MMFCNSVPGDTNFVRRAINIAFKTADLKNKTRIAFGTKNFKLFQRDIENPHDKVHDFAHCEMRDLLTASYDPIFWLHHSYVDRVFAFWQELNTLRKFEIGKFDKMDKSLNPFHRPEYNKVRMTLENSRSQDVFDYENTFCYKYDTLTFDNMTPEEFLKKEHDQQGQKSCSGTSAQCSAMMIENNKRVIVGVIMPQLIKSDIHTYEICQDEECVPGGSVSTFGYKEDIDTEKKVSKKTHVILYDEITDLVKSIRWTADKMEARMTTNLVTGMPQPLVIVRSNEKESVLLPPKQRREDYGDLLGDIIGDYGDVQKERGVSEGGVYEVL